MTREDIERLARAKACGYLIASTRDPLYDAWSGLCQAASFPCVCVMRDGYFVHGSIDFKTTDDALSRLGAVVVGSFYDAVEAIPDGCLVGGLPGSDLVVLHHVPVARADELGEMLVMAATAEDVAGEVPAIPLWLASGGVIGYVTPTPEPQPDRPIGMELPRGARGAT